MIAAAWIICLLQLIVGTGTWLAAQIGSRRLEARGPAAASPSTPHVIIAATGLLPHLEDLREALAAQTVSIGRLTFAVEATDDPAFDRLTRIFASFPVPVSIVIAGLATMGGQKSLNLVAALRTVDDGTPLVLADADIVPQQHWLATLLRPIDRLKADIVTGYRWPVPLDARVPTLFVAWTDRAVAALPRLVGGGLVWGGSVALAAGVCTRIDLLDRLEGQISDDLFLTALAREHGLRVAFTTGALLATPVRHGWRSMFQFGRRQYQMVRLYAPMAYGISLAVTAFNLLGSTLPLVLIATTRWAAMAYAAIVGTAMLASRARARLGAAASVNPASSVAERALPAVALVLPIVHLMHLLMIVAAVRVRTVSWGHCTYRMRGRRVVAVERRPYRPA